jgi:uncharacterized membrane protein
MGSMYGIDLGLDLDLGTSNDDEFFFERKRIRQKNRATEVTSNGSQLSSMGKSIAIVFCFLALPLLFLAISPALGILFVFLFVGYGLISHLLPERKQKNNNKSPTLSKSGDCFVKSPR